MQNVGQARDVAVLSLLSVQAILVAARLPSCDRRAQPLCLIGVLGLLAGTVACAGNPVAYAICVLGVLWGGLVLSGPQSRRRPGWAALGGAFLAAEALSFALGLTGTLSFRAFHLLGLAFLGGASLVRLARQAARTRAPYLLVTLAAVAGWFAAVAAPAVARVVGRSVPDCSAWLAGGLALCTGWLVFQERYPLRTAPGSAHARLQRPDEALGPQGRLMATAHLAMAAAHEFRSTLSTVRLAAGHALSLADSAAKDESLKLLLELAEAGERSAVSVLLRLAREGREPECTLDALRDFADLVRKTGTPFRAEGILVRPHLAEGVRFVARKGEVEQILLCLLRNAIEAYRGAGRDRDAGRDRGAGRDRDAGPHHDAGEVVVEARCQGETAVLEVSDRAGGVPIDAEQDLFSVGSSRSASTGLGLYLARGLAQANGGFLEYLPLDGGSLFRLTFPLADDAL